MYGMRQTHEIWILYQINYYSLKTAAAVLANKSQKWINLGKNIKLWVWGILKKHNLLWTYCIIKSQSITNSVYHQDIQLLIFFTSKSTTCVFYSTWINKADQRVPPISGPSHMLNKKAVENYCTNSENWYLKGATH